MRGALQMFGGCDFTVLIYTSMHIIKMVYQTIGLCFLHRVNGPVLMSWSSACSLHWLIKNAPVPFKAIYMDIRNSSCILFILTGQSLSWFGITIKRKQDKATPKLSCRRRVGQWTLGSSTSEHSLTNSQQATLQNNVFSRILSQFSSGCLLN